MFMLYGTSELPDIITQPEGRPVFADPDLLVFPLPTRAISLASR
jgi:phosphopantetheinyl transferase